jgi:hypothetical protein
VICIRKASRVGKGIFTKAWEDAGQISRTPLNQNPPSLGSYNQTTHHFPFRLATFTGASFLTRISIAFIHPKPHLQHPRSANLKITSSTSLRSVRSTSHLRPYSPTSLLLFNFPRPIYFFQISSYRIKSKHFSFLLRR